MRFATALRLAVKEIQKVNAGDHDGGSRTVHETLNRILSQFLMGTGALMAVGFVGIRGSFYTARAIPWVRYSSHNDDHDYS